MPDPKFILKLDFPMLTDPAQVALDEQNIRAIYAADLSWFNTIMIVARSWQEVPNDWGTPLSVKALNSAWHHEKYLVMGRTLFPVFPSQILRGYSSATDYVRPEFYGMALQQMAAEKDRFRPDAMFLDTGLYGNAHCLSVAGRDLTPQERADVYDAASKAATYLPPTYAGMSCWSDHQFGYEWYLNTIFGGGASGSQTWYARSPGDVAPLSAPPQIPDPNALLTYWTTKAGRVGYQDDGGGKMKLLSSEIMALDVVQIQAAYPNFDGIIVHIDRDDFANVMAEWGQT